MIKSQSRSRNFWQFSLRSLVVLFTLTAVLAAWFARKVQVEQEESRLLKIIQDDCNGMVFFQAEHSEPRPSDSWRLFPKNRLDKITGVSFTPIRYSEIDPFASATVLDPFPNEGLEQLGRLPNLDWLSFSTTNVTDEQLACLTMTPNLETLHFDYCEKVTDAGLAHVAGLSKLKVLSFRGTNITDAGLRHIAKLSNLQKLSLEETQIRGSGLSELEKVQSLQKLDLYNTPASRDGLEAVWALREKRPKVEINPPHPIMIETAELKSPSEFLNTIQPLPIESELDTKPDSIELPHFNLDEPAVPFELSAELTQRQIEELVRGYKVGMTACGGGEYKGETCTFFANSYDVYLTSFAQKRTVTLEYLKPKGHEPILIRFRAAGSVYKRDEKRDVLVRE